MAWQDECIEHFKNLLRIDTSNPPGREMEAIRYLHGVLSRAGHQPFIQETDRDRGNIVVRIKGSGEKAPLLISSHVDVVRAEPDKWKHPPFSAAEDGGFIYGRGAIDMKNFTTMCLMAILTAQRESWNLRRDLIMSAVSDEEAGSDFGMVRLVDEHPELINAEYALGELGAATHFVGDKSFYPVQAGEKGVFWINVRFVGSPGHGSIPRAENVHWRVGRFLKNLEEKAMPAHFTKTSLAFLRGLAGISGVTKGLQMHLLTTPLAPQILKTRVRVGGEGAAHAAAILAMITNTVNPTGIESGYQHNVVPSTVTIKLDCRVIPGIKPAQVVKEIEQITGEKLDYEVVNQHDGYEAPIQSELFRLMCRQLEAGDPGSTAIPMLTTGFTDAGQLQKLGIKCYGFTPVKLPQGISFADLYHGHNERIPKEGFLWGTQIFLDTVKKFCC